MSCYFNLQGAITFVVICSLAGPVSAQWPGFATRNLYTSQNGSSDVLIKDFNGDEILDVITANAALSSVSVFLGNGDGTFQSASNYSTINLPSNVVSADFNNDGIDDLATSNGDNGVSILLGFSNGTFSDFTVISVSGRVGDLVAIDYNGDNKMDLVTANTVANNIAFLEGNGDGTFTAGTTLSTGNAPYIIETGEFNSDGVIDLITANEAGDNVTVFLMNSSGGLLSSSNIAMGDRPFGLAVGYIDDDEFADIATTNINDDEVVVRLGNGDGTFQGVQPLSFEAYDIELADFDGDGFLDLAAGNRSVFGTVTIHLGEGDGTFGSAFNFSTNQSPVAVAADDLDGDGVMDLAVAHSAVGGRMASFVNLGEPVLDLSSNSIDFGTIEFGSTASPIAVDISNLGTGILTSSMSLLDDGLGTFSLTSVPSNTIAVSETDSFTVSFAPSDLGVYTGELSVVTNSTSGTLTIPLAGVLADTVPPTSEIVLVAAELSDPSEVLVFEVVSSDNVGGSGVVELELFYRFEGGTYQSAGTGTGPYLRFDTASASGEGSYDFYTVASDAGGAMESPPSSPDITVQAVNLSSILQWEVVGGR